MQGPVFPHCDYCGRQVSETRHTRTSYRVGFYRMRTGEVETAWLAEKEDHPPVAYQRLVVPRDVIVCADCYARPDVRRERDRLFRLERTSSAEPENA